MARVKRGTKKNKTRKNLLKTTKGYMWGRKNKEATAWTAMAHAGKHAFNDRRKKKGVFRALWNVKINAAVREHGLSYSQFINKLKQSGSTLDRKVLADIADNKPETFKRIVEGL